MILMIKKLLISTILLISLIYFGTSFLIGKEKLLNFKELITQENRTLIKKIFFPYKFISQLENRIEGYEIELKDLEYDLTTNKEYEFKTKIADVYFDKREKIILDDSLSLRKYKILEGFHHGIHPKSSGTGYIQFYNDNFFIVSATGVLAYGKISDESFTLKQIKTNLENFLSSKTVKKDGWFTIRDLYIDDNKIYISFNNELKEDCWNTGIVYSNLNTEEIKFEKLFISDECIVFNEKRDKKIKEFNANQSGGRITSINSKEILFTIGDYRSRDLVQDTNSIFGKIHKMNIENKQAEIFSIGHRNPQGLLFDKENNLVLSTEHGPKGGDEINLIKLNNDKIPNYGWPIASYGEHYGGRSKKNKEKYEKYPLLKSHKDNGFIEPLKSFQPSIGISQITHLGEKKYVVSSMIAKSIYFFDLNEKNEINEITKVNVGERVRDITFYDGKLYLLLENSASLGVIEVS